MASRLTRKNTLRKSRKITKGGKYPKRKINRRKKRTNKKKIGNRIKNAKPPHAQIL